MKFRSHLSPTVDRFVAVNFLGPFAVCVTGFTAAYLLGDIFDRFDDLLHYGGLGILGLEYFLLKLPLIVSQLLPVACLAGALLGFALLNRTGEVLACQQLGISRLEMAAPVLFLAVAISVFNFALSETVVPLATRQAKYLYRVKMKKREIQGVFANRHLWLRVRGGFMSADGYDRATETLSGIALYRVDNSYDVSEIFRATTAKWNGREWTADGVTHLQTAAAPADATSQPFRIDVTPADLGLLRLDPEEFSVWELNRYIRGLKRKGLDPGGYVVDRDLKYAMPISCLIMVALGMTLSLDPLPRNLSLGRSFGLAILIGFGYWLAFGLTSSLGHSGILPAWFAAWSPNALFAMMAGGIFLFGEER
ncbi:MAG TPA: LPS export ABC transporter permease LptG [Candidatus Binataceae bacterium]|nr:LPS export ABC transporter permease LptG [Candidatus Binataceae bacterium]